MLRAWSRHLRNLLPGRRPRAGSGTRARRKAALCLEVLDRRLTPSLAAVSSTAFPFSAVVSVEATFPHGGPGNGPAYVHGSGAVIDRFHVLTAGHMIYDASYGGFATSVVVTPAENGNYAPFGTARMVWERVYNGWEAYSSQHPGQTGQGAADIGLITLDTAIGDRTGWFGMYYYNTNDPGQLNGIYGNLSLNTAGYPGSNLHPVSLNDGEVARGDTMYHDFGRVSGVSSDGSLVEYPQLETHPGQSGSPVWFYDGHTDSSIGIDAVEVGTGFGTCITQQMYNDFHSAMDYDATNRPPQPAGGSSGTTYSVRSFSYDARVDSTTTWTPPNNATAVDAAAPAAAPTTAALTLSASVPSATVGRPVTLTALVTAPGSATPGGTVTFYDNGTVLGQAPLYSYFGYAYATWSTSDLAVGSHTLTAVYGGDDSHEGGAWGAAAVQITPVVHTTPAGSQGVTPAAPLHVHASLITRRVGRRKALFIHLTFSNGRAAEDVRSPFQSPVFKGITVAVKDANGDGSDDSVVVTARKGRTTRTATLAV
jgi:V8-like Glu-specific endopeptidase